MIERRVHKRELVDAPVRLYHPVLGSMTGKVQDLSKGGMYIVLDEVAELHTGECDGRLHCNLVNIDVLFYMECVRITNEGVVLVHLEEEAEMAKQFSHLTAKQAAQLAVEAGVRQLFLTHISRRYRERDMLAEAQAVFPGAVVARDFDSYQIKRSA